MFAMIAQSWKVVSSRDLERLGNMQRMNSAVFKIRIRVMLTLHSLCSDFTKFQVTQLYCKKHITTSADL